MKRRNFFKTAAVGGGIIALAPLSSCVQPTSSNASDPNYTDFELNELTISQLQEQMSSGKLTSEEITRKYLDRIELVNINGPELRAVIEINPEAIKIAQELDIERMVGKLRGPLHGIPVLIKDNIDTGDQMQTTACSLALVGSPAPDDAIIVQKLREAGAVLLGKTNLSEWANFRSTKSSSGWSGRGGQVRNPFCLDRSPCGSSSGTGAAVSANLCAVGIGTETDGSIVCPSGINGIVGIKPTVGLWSGDGIIPISHSQDTAGPMARTVSDAAVLLGLLAEKVQDYTQYLDVNGLKNTRILEDPVYLEALKKSKKLTREDGIDKLMNEHRLDALIAPTNGPA
ncbi:MAG: amidase family protein, partial [Bacteroidota bacterium]|nr:amidase family protein [Bacteroidota bacterium]